MSFKENFTRICLSKNESPTNVCVKLGYSNSTYSQWTDKTVPRKSTLIKIADYFGVTVDYLLGKEDAPTTDASLSENEIKLLTLFRAVPEDKQEHLLRIVEDALNILR